MSEEPELSNTETLAKLERDAATTRQIRLEDNEDRRKKLVEAAERRVQEAKVEGERQLQEFDEQVKLEMEEPERSFEEENSNWAIKDGTSEIPWRAWVVVNIQRV